MSVEGLAVQAIEGRYGAGAAEEDAEHALDPFIGSASSVGSSCSTPPGPHGPRRTEARRRRLVKIHGADRRHRRLGVGRRPLRAASRGLRRRAGAPWRAGGAGARRCRDRMADRVTARSDAEARFLRVVTSGDVDVVDLTRDDDGRCIDLIETYADLGLGSGRRTSARSGWRGSASARRRRSGGSRTGRVAPIGPVSPGARPGPGTRKGWGPHTIARMSIRASSLGAAPTMSAWSSRGAHGGVGQERGRRRRRTRPGPGGRWSPMASCAPGS